MHRSLAMKKHTPATLALLFGLVGATTLMAQAPTHDIDAVTDTPAVQVQQSSGVQFLNGGVGVGDRAAMRARQAEFPLQIVFSAPSGAYGVADRVSVSGAKGEVVDVHGAGPLLMVKLPPGRYTVQADFGGHTERRLVQVAQAPQLVLWASAKLAQN
jgi:hypothetical protein